jgi:hypothetical protein
MHRLVVVSAVGMLSILGISAATLDKPKAEQQPDPPAEPTVLIGTQGNVDPVFENVASWSELIEAEAKEPERWYRQCLADRRGMSWTRVEELAKMEKGANADDPSDDKPLFTIEVANVANMPDDAAVRNAIRQDPRYAGVTIPDTTPVNRVGNLNNTRGVTGDRCRPWDDSRSQIRLALADVRPDGTLEPAVLAMCSNPLGKEQPPPPATTPPPPVRRPPPPRKQPPPPATTTTTRPPATTSTTRPPTTTTTTAELKNPAESVEENPATPPARTCGSGTCTTTAGPADPGGVPDSSTRDPRTGYPTTTTTTAPNTRPPETTPPTTSPPSTIAPPPG